MRHRKRGRKFGRQTSQRRALLERVRTAAHEAMSPLERLEHDEFLAAALRAEER